MWGGDPPGLSCVELPKTFSPWPTILPFPMDQCGVCPDLT